MSLLTTQQAADKLGVSRRRVIALITNGKLIAQKMGRDYFIDEDDLKLVEDRKPGRPQKPDSELKNKRRSPKTQTN